MINNIEYLMNVVRREVYRVMQTYSHGKMAEVTSYDPKTHMAKVKFKPRDNESGWLPIQSHHVGGGFGIMVGLSKGDMVKVEPHNGDANAMQIVSRYHHDKAKPPKVESGEILIKSKDGAGVFIDKNGGVAFNSAPGKILKINMGGMPT